MREHRPDCLKPNVLPLQAPGVQGAGEGPQKGLASAAVVVPQPADEVQVAPPLAVLGLLWWVQQALHPLRVIVPKKAGVMQKLALGNVLGVPSELEVPESVVRLAQAEVAVSGEHRVVEVLRPAHESPREKFRDVWRVCRLADEADEDRVLVQNHGSAPREPLDQADALPPRRLRVHQVLLLSADSHHYRGLLYAIVDHEPRPAWSFPQELLLQPKKVVHAVP